MIDSLNAIYLPIGRSDETRDVSNNDASSD